MPKVGNRPVDQRANHRHRIFARGRRIAGAVGQEHAVRIERQHFLGGGGGGQHRHLAAGPRQQAQDVALHAVVDGDHVIPRIVLVAIALRPHPGGLVPVEALGRGDAGHQVHALQPRPGLGLCFEGLHVEHAVGGMGDDGIGHAAFADEGGQGAGVDARNAGNAAGLQPLIEMARGAVVGRVGDGRAQHHAAHTGGRGHGHRLDVLLVGAHIADMGEGEGDDLAAIGRIREDLLIAGDGGVEAHLPHPFSDGAEAEAFKDGTVREHQQRGRLGFDPAVGTADGGMGVILFLAHGSPR